MSLEGHSSKIRTNQIALTNYPDPFRLERRLVDYDSSAPFVRDRFLLGGRISTKLLEAPLS